MRADSKDWAKEYSHYMLKYKWRRREKEVMFSLPISSPFAIPRVNFWISDHFIDRNDNVALMIFMCNMTQYVIVSQVSNEIVATLV